MSNFSVYGPFEMPRKPKGLIDDSTDAKKKFWEGVEKAVPGLPKACGCYIFVVKARRGSLPWYVGRTTKNTFKGEAYGAHQINQYDPAIVKKTGVTPQMFLIAKRTDKAKRFARHSQKHSKNSHKDIEYLESVLIGIALKRNQKLENLKSTKYLKELCVPGVINHPRRRPNAHESKLKSALGLS